MSKPGVCPYRLIYCRGELGSKGKDIAYEHRLVAARMLGRELRRDEYIHHVNGDKNDNRPENIIVCSCKEHMELHARYCPDCGKKFRGNSSKPCSTCVHKRDHSPVPCPLCGGTPVRRGGICLHCSFMAAERVLRTRQILGVSQHDLAERAGILASGLCRYERKIKPISLNIYRRLLNALFPVYSP